MKITLTDAKTQPIIFKPKKLEIIIESENEYEALKVIAQIEELFELSENVPDECLSSIKKFLDALDNVLA